MQRDISELRRLRAEGWTWKRLAEVHAERADNPVMVHGTAVKVTSVAGSVRIHLQHGTGDASTGTNDLVIHAEPPVTVGQRVASRGVLRTEVDIGFGYHSDVLLREAVLVELEGRALAGHAVGLGRGTIGMPTQFRQSGCYATPSV